MEVGFGLLLHHRIIEHMFDSLGRENSAPDADPDDNQVSYRSVPDVDQVSYSASIGPPNSMIQPAHCLFRPKAPAAAGVEMSASRPAP